MKTSLLLAVASAVALAHSSVGASESYLAVVGDTSVRAGSGDGENAAGTGSLGISAELQQVGIFAALGYGMYSRYAGSSPAEFREGIAQAIEGGYGGVIDLRFSPWRVQGVTDFSCVSGLYLRARVPLWSYDYTGVLAVPETGDPDTVSAKFSMLSPRAAVGYWLDVRQLAYGELDKSQLEQWKALGIGLEVGATSRFLFETGEPVRDALDGKTAFHGMVTSLYIVVNAMRLQMDVPCFFGSPDELSACSVTVGLGGRADLFSTR